MNLRRCIAGLLATANLLAASAAVSGSNNIVLNGSFESPFESVTPPDSTTPTDWSNLGNGSGVDIIVTGFSGSSAPDGRQYVDLIGGGIGSFPSGLTQMVGLKGATPYKLSFLYNGARYNDGSSTFGAVLDYSLGSVVSGAINVDAFNAYGANGPITPWQLNSSLFSVATDGNYALTFSTPIGAFASPLIDDIQIVAVPEPSTAVILIAGAISCSVMARCFRRKMDAR